MSKLFAHFKTNWKTTAAGIGTLLVAAPQMTDPSALQKPETVTLVLTAIGLIFASDSRAKDEQMPKPQDPPKS